MAPSIGPGTHVTMHYTLRDGRGNLLESTEHDDPHAFVWGYSTLVPGLESALEGSIAGEVIHVTVAPEDAYGLRDPTDIFAVDREEFPKTPTIEKGQEFSAEGDDGTTITMRVVEVHDDHVVVDANHPLAGETLNFQVRVLSVREASDDEVLNARAEIAALRTPLGEAS
jgi:FKBP-type peptidyl-prolyl cis-trans isomerase SlyD